MSKYYIGGVATVAAFNDNKHMFTAKTLTDSSINISVSNEEIRGGEGAQLLGKFFHTTVFNLSLTDALFDLGYIANQVGNDVDTARSAVIWKTAKPDNVSASGKTVTFTLESDDTLATINFGTNNASETYYAWCDKIEGENGTFELTVTGRSCSFEAGSTAEASKFASGDYCVTYPITKNGSQVQVNAMYYPKVFSLIMRARLFVGDACAVSTGRHVGEVVIEIPRFQLDGTIDLAMAMTSPATYALNGSALANGCGCGDDAWYARITQVIFDEDPYAGYTGIVADDDTIHSNMTLGIYAFASGKIPKSVPYSMLTVTGEGVSADGTVTADANNASIATITVSASTSAIYNESVQVVIPAGV